MKLNQSSIYRAWRYYRDGYNLYISKPIGIMNFLTLMFYLVMERVSVLKSVFTNFYIFALVALAILVPLSTYLGWWNMRRKKSPWATEQILALESNPTTAYLRRVEAERVIAMFEALNIPVPSEYMNYYAYFKRLDDKWGWRPS